VTVGGDILSLAPSGTGINIVGTVTVVGGETTATATAARKHSAGGKIGVSIVLIGLQFFLTVLVYCVY
jgi:hypothetical protein